MAKVAARNWIASVGRWLRRPTPAGTLPPAPVASAGVTASQIDHRIGVMLEEWKEIRVSLRELASRQFARLALYGAASAALVAGYLHVAASHEPAAGLARWVLPSLGVLVSVIFLVMEWGAAAVASELAYRGRQIEACLQILMPGVGHVRAPALLSSPDIEGDDWLRSGLAASCVLYSLLLLAWAAALASAAVGWPAPV
jgi:hypothetical protein